MARLEDAGIGRREFLQGAAALAAAGAVPVVAQESAASSAAQKPGRLVGIQVGAVSFVDEGVDQVLDIFQQQGHVNAIFLATFTYGRGIAGRQIPGQPLPDHGKQEYDAQTFRGGNYATPHAKFYEKTTLKQ